MPGAGVTLSLSLSLLLFFCSPSRSPSTLFHSSFSSSLSFQFFFLFFVPPRLFYVFSTPARFLSSISCIFAKKKKKRRRNFARRNILPREEQKSASSRPRHFSSRWKTISTPVNPVNQWWMIAKLSRSRVPLLLAGTADCAILRFLAIPSGIFASPSKMSKSPSDYCLLYHW